MRFSKRSCSGLLLCNSSWSWGQVVSIPNSRAPDFQYAGPLITAWWACDKARTSWGTQLQNHLWVSSFLWFKRGTNFIKFLHLQNWKSSHLDIGGVIAPRLGIVVLPVDPQVLSISALSVGAEVQRATVLRLRGLQAVEEDGTMRITSGDPPSGKTMDTWWIRWIRWIPGGFFTKRFGKKPLGPRAIPVEFGFSCCHDLQPKQLHLHPNLDLGGLGRKKTPVTRRRRPVQRPGCCLKQLPGDQSEGPEAWVDADL